MKQYLNSGLLLSLLIGNSACGLTTASPETVSPSQTIQAESRASFATDLSTKQSAGESKKVNDSVAGTYRYDTYTGKKEGYNSTLEITEKDGKLSVSVSGMYVYPVNDIDDTFKSTEGSGEGKLSGDTAKIELLDEHDAICHATIKFAANQATLKVSEACYFNVVLNGVYKKVSADSSGIETENQANLRKIPYDKLMDFVNNHDNHKVGEEYVIAKVSPAKLQKKIPADKDGREDYKDLFYLEESDDDGYIGNGLLVSKEMLESLTANAKSKASTLRMQAILAESKGESDWVYRMSFVTKIEGLDKTGKVLWTAESAKPEKINFRH